MSVLEIRDSEEARLFLLQGWCLERMLVPSRTTLPTVLDWALELATAGEPLPPLGVIADLGHLAFDIQQEQTDQEKRRQQQQHGLPTDVVLQYEDHVLGRLEADTNFERATDGMAKFQEPRDRAKGLAFLISQLQIRTGFGGVMLSPATIKTLMQATPAHIEEEAWSLLPEEELHPGLLTFYQELIQAVRNTGELLGAEDVFELEHGTALAEFGQRLALRQVLQASAELEQRVPRQPVMALSRAQQVATHILDEDTYPVGGFTSISTRGTVESLLHSQLAYMETEESPDLFDIKFVRDELLYYSRDENQFLRRRRTFVAAFYPELKQARVKDKELRWQRVVLVLAVLNVAVQKLIEWLSDDALVFEFVFLQEQVKAGPQPPPSLQDEYELLEMLFREQINNGTVVLHRLDSEEELEQHCHERAKRSLCHSLLVTPDDAYYDPEESLITRLVPTKKGPLLGVDDQELRRCAEEETTPMGEWEETLLTLLRAWI